VVPALGGHEVWREFCPAVEHGPQFGRVQARDFGAAGVDFARTAGSGVRRGLDHLQRADVGYGLDQARGGRRAGDVRGVREDLTDLTNPPGKTRRRDWKPAFLAALRVDGDVAAAARAARITRQAAYAARSSNSHFANDWDEAKEKRIKARLGVDSTRSMPGAEKTVVYRGQRLAARRGLRDWRPAFLDVLRRGGRVPEASRVAGVTRQAAYAARKADEAFSDAWEDAQDEFIGVLEREAIRRAVIGVETPIFYKGEQIGIRRKPSDRLLMFLLERYRPDVYGKNGRGLRSDYSEYYDGKFPGTWGDSKYA
jgi:hypothetical protein